MPQPRREHVKHIRIQYKNNTGFITIGEYIQQLQPNIFRQLRLKFKLYIKDVTDLVLASADIAGRDKYYKSIMQERPKPGRGGLLPGEKEGELHGEL